MVGLRIVELGHRFNLGCDLTVLHLSQLALKRAARHLGDPPLRRTSVVDGGTVLRTGIVPLPHALRWIVVFPERLEQPLVGDLEWHEHN